MNELFNRPKLVVNVDLDDRCYLFPEAKPLTQLRVLALPSGSVAFEAVFAVNESRCNPELFSLSADDAHDFCRRMVDAVYKAQTQYVVSDTARLTFVVAVNGFILQIGDLNNSREVFLGPGVIWRFINGVMRCLDQVSPVQSH